MSSPDWVAVGSALLRAEEAVKADNEGKYKQALVCYKDAILLLDEQVRFVFSVRGLANKHCPFYYL